MLTHESDGIQHQKVLATGDPTLSDGQFQLIIYWCMWKRYLATHARSQLTFALADDLRF